MNKLSIKPVKNSNLLFVTFTSVILIGWAHSCLAQDVALKWDPNSEPDLAGYRIYSRTGETFDANGSVMAADVTTNSATITGLDPGQTYTFAVTAYNQNNLESGYSNSVTVSNTFNSPLSTVSTPSTNADGSSLPADGASVTTVVTDTTAPAVTLTSPANNSTVTGSVKVSSTAVDNVAVSRVEFYENGVLTAAMNVSPYTYTWNTGNSSNGTVILTARAYDTSGNVGQSSVAVAVGNVTTQSTAVKTSSSTSETTRPATSREKRPLSSRVSRTQNIFSKFR